MTINYKNLEYGLKSANPAIRYLTDKELKNYEPHIEDYLKVYRELECIGIGDTTETVTLGSGIVYTVTNEDWRKTYRVAITTEDETLVHDMSCPVDLSILENLLNGKRVEEAIEYADKKVLPALRELNLTDVALVYKKIEALRDFLKDNV